MKRSFLLVCVLFVLSILLTACAKPPKTVTVKIHYYLDPVADQYYDVEKLPADSEYQVKMTESDPNIGDLNIDLFDHIDHQYTVTRIGHLPYMLSLDWAQGISTDFDESCRYDEMDGVIIPFKDGVNCFDKVNTINVNVYLKLENCQQLEAEMDCRTKNFQAIITEKDFSFTFFDSVSPFDREDLKKFLIYKGFDPSKLPQTINPGSSTDIFK